MSYSDWLRTDLHIHSIMSNQTKHKDYDGVEYSADELISKLIENKVKLFLLLTITLLMLSYIKI